MNKKQQVITRLYALCKERGNLTFDNDEVRRVAAEVGFKNPFDATKWDTSVALPDTLRTDDIFPVHLGQGKHQFVTGMGIGYHRFEHIPDGCTIKWPYRRSILDDINTTESNIPYMGYNHRITHDFLYEDILASPKLYLTYGAIIPLDYRIGPYQCQRQQSAGRDRLHIGAPRDNHCVRGEERRAHRLQCISTIQPLSTLFACYRASKCYHHSVLLPVAAGSKIASLSVHLHGPKRPRLNSTRA